jgi:hypothetical protein
VIIRKPCKGGLRTAVPTPIADFSSSVPSLAKSPVHRRRKDKKTTAASAPGPVAGPSSITTVYDTAGAPLGKVLAMPRIDLKSSVSHKRLALSPPTSAEPSSSKKTLRSSQSSAIINRTSSAMSTSSSLPSPLSFTPSLPARLPVTPTVLPARMLIDPPEDQVMVLLDALEFAIDRGNMDDARKRIRALRKLRQMEKGHPGV